MKKIIVGAIVPVLIALSGCGGGGSATSAPKIVSSQISTFPGNNSGSTGPLTSTGGHTEMQVAFSAIPVVNPNSVLLDVVDNTGKSLLGGPQHIGNASAANSTAVGFNYSYSLTIPANTTHQQQVYTFTVTATDTSGHTLNPPANIGTVVVPGS